nr:glycosyl hydrolase family 28-related protein [Brevundimonas diminuta]
MAALPENDRISGPFIAGAGQTDFPADFPVINTEAVHVRRVREGVSETFSGGQVEVLDGTGAGFTARLSEACQAGDRIWVYSRLPRARLRAHTPNGSVRTLTLEDDATALQAQLQEVQRDLSYAVVVEPGDTPPSTDDVAAAAEAARVAVEAAEQVFGKAEADLTNVPSAAIGNKAIQPAGVARALSLGEVLLDFGVNVRWFGAKGDGVTDDTAALIGANVAAAVLGREVFYPAGRYRITDTVTKPANVSWYGVDRTKSVIYADAGFNLSATAIIKYAASENSSGLFDLGIECYQDPATPNRASLINYPRMLDLRATPRFQLDRIRLSGGRVGADVTQNSGGGWIGRIETGCTDIGIDIDGALDFIHIESVHDWPFVGASMASSLGPIMRDGERIALRINAADGLSIGQFAAFMGRVVIEGTAVNNIPIQFGSLQLDGDKSALEVAGKIVQVSNFYSTKASSPITSLKVAGGRLTISNAEFSTSGTAVTPITVSGGLLSINGGRFLAAADVNARMATLSGGSLFIRNMAFDLSTSAERTTPYIASTGGSLIVQNCRAPITANGGVLISVAEDGGNHNISNNVFQGWRLALPANPVLGCYGPNSIGRSSFTPTVSFATNGNFAPSYAVQDGRYWFDGAGIQFQARVVFDSNAYSGASGELRIGGFPISLSGVQDRTPVTIGRADKLTRTTNYHALTAEVSVASNAIRIIQIADGLLGSPITPSNLPASTQNFDISISGFIGLKNGL